MPVALIASPVPPTAETSPSKNWPDWPTVTVPAPVVSAWMPSPAVPTTVTAAPGGDRGVVTDTFPEPVEAM